MLEESNAKEGPALPTSGPTETVWDKFVIIIATSAEEATAGEAEWWRITGGAIHL